MAHYRGTVQGGRGEASRLGHKSTGIYAQVASWGSTLRIELHWRAETEEDWATISCGRYVLYVGPFAALHDKNAAQTFMVNYVKAFHKQLADVA